MNTLYENLEVHKELNQKLFSGDKLKEEVRERALDIVDFFINELPIHIDVLDIIMVGSNAAYTYSENSDFDLHIVTNFEFLESSEEILRALFDSEKSRFKNNYEITIKGYPVELYV